MKSTPLPSAFFKRNRIKLAEMLNPHSLVLVCSGRQIVRTGKQHFPFRQKSVFYYLTGINREGGLLLMNPSHPAEEMKEILLIPKSTSIQELWSGRGLSREEAAQFSGVHQVRWEEDTEGILEQMVPGAGTIYFDLAPKDERMEGVKGPDELLREKIVQRYPGIAAEPLSTLMAKLRMIKEIEEVNEIQKACRITGSAFRKAVEVVKPGVREYEVEAEIIAEFIRQGTAGHAFEPILASGENALVLHYTYNNDLCRDGELLLMDFGAEVNNYAADCTRTIPVNGKFTARQREVYEATFRVFSQARQMMVPGTKLDELHSLAGAIWEEEHIGLGLYTHKEAREHPGPEPIWKNYFLHATAHSLGLDVHDPFDRSEPFMPGLVFTCEPAIYIREEGIGIRLENDILITEEEPVDLMEDIPMQAGEIEEMMQHMD